MIIKKFIVYVVKDCGIIKFQRIQRTTNKGACSECQCILDKLKLPPVNRKRFLCGSNLHYHYYKNLKIIYNNYIYVAKKNTLL